MKRLNAILSRHSGALAVALAMQWEAEAARLRLRMQPEAAEAFRRSLQEEAVWSLLQ